MVTIVKVVTRNHSYPLIMCGNADEGDIIVMAKVYDSSNSKRSLGIVVSKSSKRKGVCVAPKKTKNSVNAYEFVV